MYCSEIISIGDEVLLGQTINGNAAFIGNALAEAGMPPCWASVVGDVRAEIQSALKLALSRAGIIVITGGLGPTPDDLTQPTLADFFGMKCAEDPELLAHVQALFASRGMTMPEQSRNQALFPVGARKIPNPHGTATGIHIEKDGCHVFSLPGVPQEAKLMMANYVIPFISEKFPDAYFKMKTLRLAGIGESLLLQKLDKLDEIHENVGLAFLPSHGLLDLRLNAKSRDPYQAEAQISTAEALIRERVGEHVYGTGNTSLAQVIGNILLNRTQTISVAESCTGGLIASTLTDIPGASHWFERGWTTYSNASKIEEVGVGALRITMNGAVSEDVSRAMAEGAMKVSGSQWGLSTTGIAGPSGGTPEKPVGTIWIAVASRDQTTAKLCNLPDTRELFKIRARNAALFYLYKRLINE